MRLCERNKQTVWYALLEKAENAVDEYGNLTGEDVRSFGKPVKMTMNVSAANGLSSVAQFGINDVYTKTAVTADMSCPIDTSSILWVGIAPDADGEDGTVKHNYVVQKVAKSLNYISYELKEVNVT